MSQTKLELHDYSLNLKIPYGQKIVERLNEIQNYREQNPYTNNCGICGITYFDIFDLDLPVLITIDSYQFGLVYNFNPAKGNSGRISHTYDSVHKGVVNEVLSKIEQNRNLFNKLIIGKSKKLQPKWTIYLTQVK